MATLTNIFQYDPKADLEFAELTRKIRPLPADIAPSPRFLEQMRLRLLALSDGKSTTQAA